MQLWAGVVVTSLVHVAYTVGIVTLVYVGVEGLAQMLRRLRSRRSATQAPDWGFRMQEAAERHLAAVSEAFCREEEGEAEVDNPAVGPYDGCETCVVREVLAGAWPVMSQMLEYHRRNNLTLHLAGGHGE